MASRSIGHYEVENIHVRSGTLLEEYLLFVGAEYGIQEREAIHEYVLSMICESHVPTVTEDELADEQVYNGLTDEYHLRYQGGWEAPPLSRSRT